MADTAQDSALKITWNNFKNATVDEMNSMGGLHSNQAINALTGIPEMGARMFRGGQGFGDAWRDTFTEAALDKAGKELVDEKTGKALRKTKWGKLAASTWAAGTALSAAGGAVRGALTDKNGNFDIPGIPLI